MAKQKTFAKPYEIIRDERDERKSQKTQLSEAQEVILKYMQGLEEPPKPVKWLNLLKNHLNLLQNKRIQV